MNTLGTMRAAVRRLISGLLGERGEMATHAFYHRLLRATRRFDPHEDGHVLAVLAAIASRSGTILDVGANIGRFTWFFKHHAPPGCLIYAFEPNPNAMMLLSGSLHGARNVHCLQFALGDRDGAALMEVPTDAMGNSMTALGWVAATANGGAKPSAIGIDVRRLDSMVDEGLVRPVAPVLMKIDVEGGEHGVLNGATDLLADYRPVVYFECQRHHLERTGAKPEDVWERLSALGYVILAPRDGLYRVCPTAVDAVPNYLAVPIPQRRQPINRLSAGDLIALLDRDAPGRMPRWPLPPLPKREHDGPSLAEVPSRRPWS